MFPARIEHYARPRTVAEALAALSRCEPGEAIFLAGGQSAMQAIKSRMLRPQAVVDLQAVAELKGITLSGGALTIGAMTRYADIARDARLGGAFGALSDAASHVGDRQVRNRGTIGGSVCWNYVAACTPTAVLATGGRMNLVATSGATRSLAADDFLLGPLETARQDDELLLSVSWDAPAARTGSAYAKWGLVTDALPVIGVGVSVTQDASGKCVQARVALAGLAGGAQRGPAAEVLLMGSAGDAATIDAAFAALAAEADTHSDLSADADYRRQLIQSLGREVAQRAFDRARA